MAQASVVAGEKSAMCAVRFNESLLASVDEAAAKRGATRAQLVREAVRQYLDREVAAS